MTIDLRERVRLAYGYEEDSARPILICFVTNRCNLSCAHCFFYRDGNPNAPLSPRREMSDDEVLEIVEGLRDRHGVRVMVWIGGEPMLRRSLLERGVGLFDYNVIDTNGTLPLVDLGPSASFLISLDGPPDVNDAIRGAGTFERVVQNLERLPDDFTPMVNIQCTVTRASQGRLGELLERFRGTRANYITFSFYVPSLDDTTGLAWDTLEDRMVAVEEVRQLALEHPDFVTNKLAGLDLMAPEHVPAVVSDCPCRATTLPLYNEGDHFVSGYCIYGNDVDCSRCGAWLAYEFAAEPFHLQDPPDTAVA